MTPVPSATTGPTGTVSPRQLLRQAGRALKLGRGLTALAIGVVAAGLMLGAWLAADARWHFGTLGRWTGFLGFLLPLAAALVVAARAWLRGTDEAALARRLETATGRTDNALVNAVQLDHTLAASPQWRAVLLDELAGLWRGIAWQRVYDWRWLRGWAAGAAGFLVLGWVLFLLQPGEFRQRMARVLLPAREIAALTLTRVTEVEPGNLTVSRGTPLAMRVTLAGAAPAEVWLVVGKADGTTERLLARRDGETMAWSLTRAWPESGRYWFEAGDARSFERSIEVRQPAKILARHLTITPPPYTRLPPQRVADGSPWPPIPQGSDITLECRFDRDLKELSIDHQDAQAAAGTSASDWTLSGRLAVNRVWSARWLDTLDLRDQAKVEFNLKPDEAPQVRLLEPTGEEEILLTRDAWLRLSFEASDDYGLAEVAVCRGTPEKPDARPIQSWQPGTPTLRQSVDLQLSRWVGAEESEAWFCVAARDANTVTGPGRTLSRMVVVRIVTPEELRLASTTREGEMLACLDDLLRLQQTNLDATRGLSQQDGVLDLAAAAPLAERQLRVQETAARMVALTPPDTTAWREVLATLLGHEIPQAVIALRDAASAGPDQRAALAKGEALETAILARLRNLPADLKNEAGGRAARDLVARVEALLQRQQALHGRILQGQPAQASALAGDQDALADDSQVLRQALSDGAVDASVGDSGFRAALTKAAALMAEAKVYEQMILAAEQLETAKFPAAAVISKQVLVDLARVLALLDADRRATAGEQAEALKETAAALKEKLDALVERQQAVVEKSKELASKDELSPEDEAMAGELAAEKAELARLIEQMLIDAHAFPDLRPMNELREELTKIYEDVIQQDTELAAAGGLKPSEIAVQKEESLLEALEKAAETAEDMEMWLPDKNETIKWLMENFDLTEMPEIPNLPLADSFTDLVGDLVKQQEAFDQEVQDAASNNAFAVNPANGWEVADGPMPGFNAQGKSGNTRPNKNEQTGRSSGGREGMSSGEMVNQRADQLEGSASEARRTNDPLQKGQVQDDGPPADAKATGGGKAGGVSQREGMTGEGPLRPVNAPGHTLNDALAAEQALLAQQSAKSYATARLFYLRTGAMPEVTRLMDESRAALKAGRLADYEALHRRIVAHLKDMGEGGASTGVKTLGGGGTRMVGDKRLPGGVDTQVPPGFQQPVDDYYRSLDQP